MMGEVGFVALGVDWTQARITHNWSLRLNTECTPIERHAVLYFIEQGLMTKTGKRYEWEVGVAVGRPADGHDPGLRLGRRGAARRRSAASGTSPQIGDWKQALDYGDQCWSKILSNWTERPRPGPDPARELVARHLSPGLRGLGRRARPAVLAFGETYENQRADLKTVSVSG